MSLWSSTKPPLDFDTGGSTGNPTNRRNLILTNKGWVRRQKYGTRTKDEVIVAAGSYGAGNHEPFITDCWISTTSNDHATPAYVKHGSQVNTWISFSEPVTWNLGKLKIAVANTASGNAIVAYASPTVYNSNRILFQWNPAKGGTYTISSATTGSNSTSTAANLKSTNTGTKLANVYMTTTAHGYLGSITVIGTPSPKTLAGATFAHNTTGTITLAFTDPISVIGSGDFKINVANTAGGNAMVAYSTGTVTSGNKLSFAWHPSVAGTYTVNNQTIGNTTSIHITQTTTLEAANLVISSGVAGTLGSITVS